MPGRRLVAALAILALTATACHGPSRSGQASSRPSISTSAPGPAPAVPSYSAGRSQPVADPVYPNFGNPAIDVLHYELALRWAPSTRTLSGTATLAIRATKDIGDIRLDFARPLRADTVTVDGKAATATHRGHDLIIGAGQRLARDARVVVAVRYHGRPRTLPGPMVRKDISAVGFNVRPDGSVFALQEPYGALTWYPVNDQPSDEALYDVALTVPRGWAGVSNGVLRGTSKGGDGVTFSWHAADPIASYLVALGIDRYRKYTATGPHGIPVTYWVRPQDRARAMPVLRKTPRMLAWLEKRFGRYPFASAGVFAIREGTAMETQTMVTFGNVPEEALLHELAHQWFGDSVGPRTWREVWLNEGFATYIQFLLYDVEVLGQSQARFLAGMRQLDGQLRRQHGPPGRYKPGHFASPNVYFPPALMLHEIRKKIGDKKFFAMMRAWAQQHRNIEADRALFTSWLNRYTGRNLTRLVNRWLDSPTTPAATGG
jgi:aminopeptidase N